MREIVPGGKHRPPATVYMAPIRISFVILNPGLLRRRLSRPQNERKRLRGGKGGREGIYTVGNGYTTGVSAGIFQGRPPFVFEREISLGFEPVLFLFLFPFSREISKTFFVCV